MPSLSRFLYSAAFSILLSGVIANSAQAQFNGAPDAMSFQGYVTDLLDNPVNSTEDVTIRLFNSSAAGDQRWERTYPSVTITNGVFDITLVEGTPSFGVVAFDEALWVEVEIDGEVISPRVRLTSAAYALGLRNIRIQPFSQGNGPNIIGGYLENTVADTVVGATISGGGKDGSSGPGPNEVLGSYGTVGGGIGQIARYLATVGGGSHNDASGPYSVIGGGEENLATWKHNTIGGGHGNKTEGTNSTVAGGSDNLASGSWGSVGGGFENEVIAYYGRIGGGHSNHVEGYMGAVPGGYSNRADGDYSLAAGNRARVRPAVEVGNGTGDEGTFVWSDRSAPTEYFSSTGSNQFLIRSVGGVGIGTNAPGAQVHIGKPAGGKQGLLIEATNDDKAYLYFVENTSLTFDTYRGSDSRRLPIALQPNGGNVGIGTTTPSEKLQVNGNVLANNVAVPSDARYKKDVTTIADALSAVSSLRGVRYTFDRATYPEKDFDPGTHMGLIAQELREVYPELVAESESGYLSVNYIGLIPVLLEAIKEQAAQIAGRDERIDQLEARLDLVVRRLESL